MLDHHESQRVFGGNLPRLERRPNSNYHQYALPDDPDIHFPRIIRQSDSLTSRVMGPRWSGGLCLSLRTSCRKHVGGGFIPPRLHPDALARSEREGIKPSPTQDVRNV